MELEYRVGGEVVEKETGRPLPGLLVRVFDKDELYNDLLGEARTDDAGRFEVRYAGGDFQELFDKRPDLFFRIFDAEGAQLIHTTEESVRVDAGADEQVRIEIPRAALPAAGRREAGRERDIIREKAGPYLRHPGGEKELLSQVEVRAADSPVRRRTLGDFGVAAVVSAGADALREDKDGARELHAETLLVQPFDRAALAGIDHSTVRVFRVDEETGALAPVWNSGVNFELGFVWAKVARPGTYVPLGLPRDRLLRESLRKMARERNHTDRASREKAHGLTRRHLELFHAAEDGELYELRRFLTSLELQTGVGPFNEHDVRLGTGGHIEPFPLPGGATVEEFRGRLKELEHGPDGLPEEALFNPPEAQLRDAPWAVRPDAPRPDEWIPRATLDRLTTLDHVRDLEWFRPFVKQDWWMYQHDVRHTGHASGPSNISSTTVGSLTQLPAVALDGPIVTKPSIVAGKVYIGTSKSSGTGGSTLYKIDLVTGHVDGKFHTSGTAFYSWYYGIGGSPAVVSGRVYFTAVHGKVYCVDAATMTNAEPPPDALWVTDLKNADPAHNQPCHNPNCDSWSSPLVVNGRVYVGCGEGESPATYGFVYCLDAATGNVVWCFCTAKFQNRLAPGSENAPNVIPASIAVSNPLPAWATAAGFSIHNDPSSDRSTGVSVWSSCAYDATLRRIYVGTGNAQYLADNSTALPDRWYGSGLLSLDADTGEFRGFFQPAVDDSYWPGDLDIDVPGSPTIFTHGGVRVVAFGSKNGSFFLLDPDTLEPVARRQLLPRQGGSGLPGDRGTGIPSVVPTGGADENSYGVMGTPALHAGLGRIFVGVGGYNGMHLDPVGIDPTRTPFMRALEMNTLQDAWDTEVGDDGVSRYTVPRPPMYTTLEVGLSSPAVVSDVVFVSTNKAALYALDAATGLCLWAASGLPSNKFVLGPAIYGDYVVIGAGQNVYIYTLRRRLLQLPPWREVEVIRRPPFPDPDPGPLRELIREELTRLLANLQQRR